MKILCVCSEGVNRSVTLAHQLKYLGHDVLSAGLNTNSQETLELLTGWADKTIVTDRGQHNRLPQAELWDIGPDSYPRPFNPRLLAKVKTLVAEHRQSL